MSVIGTGVARVSLTWSISGAISSTSRWRRPTIGVGSMAAAVTGLAMAFWPLTWVTAFQVMSKMFFTAVRPLVPPSEAVRNSGASIDGLAAAGGGSLAACGALAVVSRWIRISR